MNDWQEVFAANIYEINLVVREIFLLDFLRSPFRIAPLLNEGPIPPDLKPFYLTFYSEQKFATSYPDLLKRKDGLPISY